MNFIYPFHAKENIMGRKIGERLVEDTILFPDKLMNSKKGRMIAQKLIENRLLRVIFKKTEKAYIVITAYYTRPERYQNGS